MFFRRVFANKDDASDVFDDDQSYTNQSYSTSYTPSYTQSSYGTLSSNQSVTNQSIGSSYSDSSSTKRLQRQLSVEDNRHFQKGLFVLQLTPLWEHIIRTNSLPPHLNVSDMFNEFQERLQENEWQVRQHALRVLVDVLIVMGQQADYHVGSIIHSLVDNLGHIAPAVRKCMEFFLLLKHSSLLLGEMGWGTTLAV